MAWDFGVGDRCVDGRSYIGRRTSLDDNVQDSERAEKGRVLRFVGGGIALGFLGGIFLGENLTEPFEYLSNSTERAKYVWTYIASTFGTGALGGFIGAGFERIYRR